MNSRERTFLALDHACGDRIPVDFWATQTVVDHLGSALGLDRDGFLDRHDVDLRYIEGPRYVGPPLGEGEDIWGVRRTAVRTGAAAGSEAYDEVTEPPLARASAPADIEAYAHWPSPDWFDYSVIERQCREILDKGRVVVFMGDRLNRVAQLKPAMYLRGTEEIFVDLAIRPAVAGAVFAAVREFYVEYLTRILDAAGGRIDVVLTGDDFGAQHGLLLNPETWRTFIRPGFTEYIGLIKDRGAVAMHHTCGSVVGIIPDMIDSGLDVLQSVQPEAQGMSLGSLKPRFGKDLCFHGGVSIQKTLPHGSLEDIRREVRTLADIVRDDGGYIFCTSHNIQADTPIENVLALMDAYAEYASF